MGRGRAVGAGHAAKRGGHDGGREGALPADGGGREAEAPHAHTVASVGKPTLTPCHRVCVCDVMMLSTQLCLKTVCALI